MSRCGSLALALVAALALPAAARAAAPGTPPAPAAPGAATAAPAAPQPAPVDPKSDAALANYARGLAALKQIPSLHAFVVSEPDLDQVLRINAKDYDFIRYQVLTGGADWELFKATHAAVRADPALKAKVEAAAK